MTYNLDRLYHCGDRANVRWLTTFRNGHFYNVLKSIYKYITTKDCITYKGRELWWVSADHMKKNFHTTKGQPFLSYCCCIGLFDKVNPGFMPPESLSRPKWESFPDDDGELQKIIDRVSKQVRLSRQKKSGNPDSYKWIKDISVYTLPRLTSERLDFINRQIGLYRKHKVYPNNVSYDLLAYEGLLYDADRVYLYKDVKNSLYRKAGKWAVVDYAIEKLLRDREYCYKAEVWGSVGGVLSRYTFEMVWSMFIVRGESRYMYRPVNKADRERWGLTSSKWIVTWV